MYKKDEILIADSSEEECTLLKEILENSYSVIIAENADEALKVIAEKGDALAVIIIAFELMAPIGKCIMDILKEAHIDKKVPVLVLNRGKESAYMQKCFEKGVTDYISFPLNETLIMHRVSSVIALFRHKKEADDLIKKQNQILKMQNKRLNRTDYNIIELLGNIVESRNLESGKHVRRVKGFTKIIAEDIMANCPKYKLTPKKTEQIVSASVLHDIGKINIPDNILLKPVKLTEDEYNLMKTHTVKGSELIEGARNIWGDEYADICRDIILYHHERYDGNGYPKGLKGDEIPIAAQIVSLADVYDALVTKRVYKKAVPPEVALSMILEGSCGAFSEELKQSLVRVNSQLKELLY